MDIGEIIAQAVAKEQEAYALYSEVAANATDPAVRSLLLDLAAEERMHEQALEKLNFTQAAGSNPNADRDLGLTGYLREVAVPSTDDLQNTLVYAMGRELEAYQLYSKLAEASDSENVRDVLLRLARMERAHKGRLENLYEEMFMREA